MRVSMRLPEACLKVTFKDAAVCWCFSSVPLIYSPWTELATNFSNRSASLRSSRSTKRMSVRSSVFMPKKWAILALGLWNRRSARRKAYRLQGLLQGWIKQGGTAQSLEQIESIEPLDLITNYIHWGKREAWASIRIVQSQGENSNVGLTVPYRALITIHLLAKNYCSSPPVQQFTADMIHAPLHHIGLPRQNELRPRKRSCPPFGPWVPGRCYRFFI